MLNRMALVIALVVTSQAHGRDKDGNYNAVGGASCGQWHEAARKSERTQYASWVAGFVSAINCLTPDYYGAALEDAQIKTFLDHYCENNPLHNLGNAAFALVEEAGGPKARHKWKR
jgi:hypothetical protein